MYYSRALTKSCRLPILVAIALAGAPISGCGEEGNDCTEMGCTPGASLTLPTPLADSGDYVFNVVVDGTTLTCTATLPFQGTNPICDPGLGLLLQGPSTSTGSATSQGPADRITGIWLDGQVGEVTVDVTRDGSPVYAGSATPAYQGVEINGPGCGECLQGTAQLP